MGAPHVSLYSSPPHPLAPSCSPHIYEVLPFLCPRMRCDEPTESDLPVASSLRAMLLTSQEQEEPKQLRRENKQLRLEREILARTARRPIHA